MNRLFAVLALSIAAFVLPATPAAAATVTYSYTGQLMTYTGSLPSNPFGDRLIGTATFDDSVVTSNFTGAVNTGFVATMGTADGWLAGDHLMSGTFRFTNGQITSWGLMSSAFRVGTVTVPIASHGVTGDSAVPVMGGLVAGFVRNSTPGVWTLQNVAPVPLPAAFPLLAGALALFGALRRRSRLPG